VKKLLGITLSLCLILGLVSMAGAEDRLTINGDFRVVGYYKQNAGNVESDNDVSYFDQRFRTAFNFKFSDMVSGIIRADWAESIWGIRDNLGPFPGPELGTWADGTDTILPVLQIEQAQATLSKPMFDLTMGLGWVVPYGFNDVWRPYGHGFDLRLKLPVMVQLSAIKWDENGTASPQSAGPGAFAVDGEGAEDWNDLSLQVAGKVAGWQIGGFYATRMNGIDEVNPSVIEVYGKGQLGPVSLGAGLDYFLGEHADGVDAVGMALYVEARAALTAAATVGGHVYYNAANDDDTKQSYRQLYVNGPAPSHFASGMPGLTWDGVGYEAGFAGRTAIGVNGDGTDPGQMGLDVYVNYKIGDFTLGAQVYYFLPVDGDLTDLTSLMGIDAGVQYSLAPGVWVALGAIYDAPSGEDSYDPTATTGVQGAFYIMY